MGFGRDDSQDNAGFRGTIPKNTIVPVIVIDSDAKLIKMKNGKNAGKTSRMYKPVFEVLLGKYKGARIYGDVWCNVEPDPGGGDPKVFGSHMLFCDLCDVAGVKDEDGTTYPIPVSEADAVKLSMRFIGTMALLTIGHNEYENRKTKEMVTKNTMAGIILPNEEQLKAMVGPAAKVTEKVAKQQARKAAEAGATGFEAPAGNNMPPAVDEDDDDLPF